VIVVYLILTAAFGAWGGALAYGAWLEARHDCMPHDPKRCQEDTDHDG